MLNNIMYLYVRVNFRSAQIIKHSSVMCKLDIKVKSLKYTDIIMPDNHPLDHKVHSIRYVSFGYQGSFIFVLMHSIYTTIMIVIISLY